MLRYYRTVLTGYYIPKAQTNDYGVIDGKNVFDQRMKSYIRVYENIGKVTLG